jgi:hypothetical protein
MTSTEWNIIVSCTLRCYWKSIPSRNSVCMGGLSPVGPTHCVHMAASLCICWNRLHSAFRASVATLRNYLYNVYICYRTECMRYQINSRFCSIGFKKLTRLHQRSAQNGQQIKLVFLRQLRPAIIAGLTWLNKHSEAACLICSLVSSNENRSSLLLRANYVSWLTTN